MLRPQPGEMMQLNGDMAGQLQRLNMEQVRGANHTRARVSHPPQSRLQFADPLSVVCLQAGGTSQLAGGASLDIPQIVGGALNNQFLMQAGATLNSAVQILKDASLTFSLADGARARFSSLNLSAVRLRRETLTHKESKAILRLNESLISLLLLHLCACLCLSSL